MMMMMMMMIMIQTLQKFVFINVISNKLRKRWCHRSLNESLQNTSNFNKDFELSVLFQRAVWSFQFEAVTRVLEFDAKVCRVADGATRFQFRHFPTTVSRGAVSKSIHRTTRQARSNTTYSA
jgi:hypothetical protein